MTRLHRSVALLLGAACFASAQDNRFEPNQTRRTAVRMEAGDYKALYCDSEDWYAIEVPAEKRLEVSAKFAHAQGDLDLEVQDKRGRLLAWSRGSKDEEVVSVRLPEAGPVFVRVHGAQAAYELHLGLEPALFNGTRGEAVQCWGSDWYPLDVTEGKELRAKVEFSHAKGDLDLSLVDDEGNELMTSSGQGDVEELRWTATANMRVLLHVFHVHRSQTEYTLTVGVGAAVEEDLVKVFQEERPETAGEDVLELRTGEVLRGTVLTERLQLATRYTNLEVAVVQLAGLKFADQGGIDRVVTVREDRLQGFVRTQELEFKLAGLDAPIRVRTARLASVIFGRRGGERSQPLPKGLVSVQLRSGDRFTGLLGEAAEDGPQQWVLDIEFAQVPLQRAEVLSLSCESNGMATVVRRDQSTIRGKLNLESLPLQVCLGGVEGPTFSVHPSAVSVINFELQQGSGALNETQLRQLLKRLTAGQASGDILREIAAGKDVVPRLKDLRPMVPCKDGGDRDLERHMYALADRQLQFAWFEILLRVDEKLRNQVARMIGESATPAGVREAGAVALVDLAINDGPYGPLETACNSPASQNLIVQAAMGSKDQNLIDWTMNRVRRFRSSRGLNVTDPKRAEFMEYLSSYLEGR
ncbi:MAG: PPC domain-containing protein [Planctomycetes bacterium]|nr:PPC domain-containing protein [Planctomycetota bacterium]